MGEKRGVTMATTIEQSISLVIRFDNAEDIKALKNILEVYDNSPDSVQHTYETEEGRNLCSELLLSVDGIEV
jgi:hypothetical protein